MHARQNEQSVPSGSCVRLIAEMLSESDCCDVMVKLLALSGIQAPVSTISRQPLPPLTAKLWVTSRTLSPTVIVTGAVGLAARLYCTTNAPLALPSPVRVSEAPGAKVIVDNTTMTPLLQRPLDLGADLVVAADTKAPSGHSDVLMGHVAGRDAGLMGRVRDWRRMAGAVPGGFEAWLVHRGLETLEVRLERMCASAATLAERLADHPAVGALRYPGLADDPSHRAVASGQMGNGGFLIGMTLADAGVAERFLADCPYIAQSTSFGGTHTAGERRARWGDPVAGGFIRLSVGVEPVEPLWAAIEAALAP